MKKHYHMIVLGAGSGGLVSAAGAAGLGAKVALIEKHKMGGDCLNTGCVPSKAIIRAAKLVYDAKSAERFGIPNLNPDLRLDRILESVRQVQKKIEPHDSEERFTSLGVEVYHGTFRFLSPHEITDGEKILSARRFVIATGGSPSIPAIPGMDQIPVLTSENVWDLTELPKRLVVLGGGPIGCELAQVFARLGSEVSLVELAPSLLVREDVEVSRLIQKKFEKEGIDVLLGITIREARKTPQGAELILSHRIEGEITLPFDRILVAAGRRPNVQGLDLEKAGVKYGPQGIEVDQTLRSSAPHIFACGDVTGPYLFTHTADFQARLILRNALFPGSQKIDYRVVPWCTFTEPEVARVGLSEKEAMAQGIDYEATTYSMEELDRAVCDRENEGFIKVLTPKGSDQILGVTLVGPHAGDVIAELCLAMHQRIGLKKIARMIHIYPTLSEVSKRIADKYRASRFTPKMKAWLKRYFEWRFGD